MRTFWLAISLLQTFDSERCKSPGDPRPGVEDTAMGTNSASPTLCPYPRHRHPLLCHYLQLTSWCSRVIFVKVVDPMYTWPWKKKQLKVFANCPDLSISQFHFSISWFLVDESISLGSAASLQSFTVACFALWIIPQDNEAAGAGIVTFTLKILLFSQSFVQVLLWQRDVFFVATVRLSRSFEKLFPFLLCHCTHSAHHQ